MNTTNLMGPGFAGTAMPTMQPLTAPLMPAPMPMPMMCLEWVVLDIETQGGDPNQVWEWIRRNWWPNEDHKPETMARRLVEAVEKKKEKLALLDSASIVMVQVKTSAGHVFVFHTFAEAVELPAGAGLVAHRTEAELLASVNQWLDMNCGEGTTIVGWNINGFDLPRLRLRTAKAGLRVSRTLTGMCGVLDLMREYARNWSVERNEFIALGDALEALGMENHKKDVDGSMVGELLERREYARLIGYGVTDVTQEAAVFLKMTGQEAAMR